MVSSYVGRKINNLPFLKVIYDGLTLTLNGQEIFIFASRLIQKRKDVPKEPY